MLVTVLLSHAGDGVTTKGCTSHVKVTQHANLEHRSVVAVGRSRFGMPIINDVCVDSQPWDISLWQEPDLTQCVE
jgi:hypothetical protein